MPPQRLARAPYSLWIAVLISLAACDAGEACQSALPDEEAFARCMNADDSDERSFEGEASDPDGEPELPEGDDVRCKPSDFGMTGMLLIPSSLPIHCGPPIHPFKP